MIGPVAGLAYGTHPSQFGELTLPAGAGPVRAVAVVVHGGFWRQAYGLELGRPLAAELVAAGWAVWNLEYRRVGGGGGWTATFDDVAAGLDTLAGAGQRAAGGRLPLDRVVAVGHSAGGQLAAWLAARPTLPAGAPGADPVVRLRGVVSQAGVLDLVDASAHGVGRGAVEDLLGARPELRAGPLPAGLAGGPGADRGARGVRARHRRRQRADPAERAVRGRGDRRRRPGRAARRCPGSSTSR